MKNKTFRYYVIDNDEIGMPTYYIVGSTAGIKAVYKSICRSFGHDMLTHCARAKFSDTKTMYALAFSPDVYGNYYMSVVNSDTMLNIIVSDNVAEIPQIQW